MRPTPRPQPQVSNGATLSITPFNPNRPRQFAHSELGSAAPLSIGAPTFVPNASVSTFSPQGQYADLPGPISPGPGQHVQPAPGSTSASGLIDFCNLYIKQIDPSISSNDLFNHFRSFGRIVSARVMRDELGVSKGFGFVSYQTPQEAHLALTSMDGAFMGSKQIVVRLHEPKKLRAEKLAEQRARGGSLSPKRASEALPGMALSEEHSRRSSGAGGAYLPTVSGRCESQSTILVPLPTLFFLASAHLSGCAIYRKHGTALAAAGAATCAGSPFGQSIASHTGLPTRKFH